jgi:hypothetical protein
MVLLGAIATSSAWGQNPNPPSAVRGTGAAGQIPVWLDANHQGNSVLTQNSDGSLTFNATSYVGLVGSTDNTAQGAVALSGIEFATSGITFGVEGKAVSPSGVGVLGVNDGASGGWGVKGQSNSPGSVGVEGFSPTVGVRGQSLVCDANVCTAQTGEAGQFIVAPGGTLLTGYVNNGGVWSPVFRVDSTGKGIYDGGTQTGGADFAEAVAAAKGPHRYEAGDVLVLDTTTDRQLRLSTEPYSTLVAGIYSTKPGVLATAHTIGTPFSSEEIPLAIVGIVPCKVSAENGSIQRGDLLVTSSTPGYAMKGTDRRRMLGTVVGKAMEPLRKGTGVILVLVTLQ